MEMKMQIQKIPNQIINDSITPLNLNRANYIVLHHAAPTVSYESDAVQTGVTDKNLIS